MTKSEAKRKESNPNLTATDLWPLVQKLTHDELVRLAKLALLAAAETSDQAPYATAPTPDEFGSDDSSLDWEAAGWEEFDAPR